VGNQPQATQPPASAIPKPAYRRIHIVINPAAGVDVPVLGTFNRVFGQAGVEWDVSITHRAGDARDQARAAARAGVDLVAAYGGDGTVMETASGLIGSGVPLAILPGGTANVLALQFAIPVNLEQACALVCANNTIQEIDVGQAGEHYFLARLSCGLEAAMIEGADRETKNRFGWLAYALAALQALSEPSVARYTLALDGQTVEHEGVACIVANTGQVGLLGTGAAMAPGISMSDGLFDILIVRQADLAALVELTTSMLAGSEAAQSLLRWQAREVNIQSDPPQSLQCDGEIIGLTPVSARILPSAVRVVVPVPPAPPVESPP
jgi:YegS/Rv2252/BmrU family lipid kinase